MSMLRRALEEALPDDNKDDDKTILLKGPLSDVYTKALNIVYAKPIGDNADGNTLVTESLPNKGFLKATVVSLETQQIDNAIIKRITHSLNGEDKIDTNNTTTIYGVSKDSLSNDTIVDITTSLVNNPDDSRFIVVIDGTTPGDNGTSGDVPLERTMDLNKAIECIVESFGGVIRHNLRDAILTLR